MSKWQFQRGSRGWAEEGWLKYSFGGEVILAYGPWDPERQQVQLKQKHGKELGHTARLGWGDRRIVQDLVGQV